LTSIGTVELAQAGAGVTLLLPDLKLPIDPPLAKAAGRTVMLSRLVSGFDAVNRRKSVIIG
jgi:hypothetical protein